MIARVCYLVIGATDANGVNIQPVKVRKGKQVVVRGGAAAVLRLLEVKAMRTQLSHRG